MPNNTLTIKDFEENKIYKCVSNDCLVGIVFKTTNNKIRYKGEDEIEASWRKFESTESNSMLKFVEHK